MSVVDFYTSKKQVPPEGYLIEKGTTLYSKPINGMPCQFSTCYPVILRPIEVTSATLREPKHTVTQGIQALVIQMKARDGLTFSQLGIEDLRFFSTVPGSKCFPFMNSSVTMSPR